MENVDRVVAMLQEAGIEVSVTNRRSWAGHDYKRPSYAKPPDRESWPQVWIVKAEDQPRARALLREAGIEPATRFAEELANARASGPEAAAQRRSAVAWRIRLFLLALIVLLVILNALHVLPLF